MDGRAIYGDADTDLARWLRARIGDTKLREIQRRAAKRGISLNASLLSNYLKLGIFPTAELVRRLAAYFDVDAGEIESLRPGSRQPVVRPEPRLDNLEYVTKADYTPDQWAVVVEVLRGVLNVAEAKARGEA